MLRSFFAGVSGLRAQQQMMDVIGNNIANVNTNGYKSSSAVFADLLSQMTNGAGVPTSTQGGTNPTQIGLGVTVAGVIGNFNQGAMQYTGRSTDLALRVQINPAELLEVVKKEIECRNLSRACGTLGKRAGLGVIVLNVSLAMFNLKLRTFLARFRLTLSPEMQDLLDNLFSETPALQEEQKIKQTAQVVREDKAQFVLREQMALLEQNIELLRAIEKILATQQAPTAVTPALPPSGHGHGHKKGVGSGQGPSSGTGTGTKGNKPPKGKPPGPQGGTP